MEEEEMATAKSYRRRWRSNKYRYKSISSSSSSDDDDDDDFSMVRAHLFGPALPPIIIIIRSSNSNRNTKWTPKRSDRLILFLGMMLMVNVGIFTAAWDTNSINIIIIINNDNDNDDGNNNNNNID
mmetsp:Transcript_42957/g.46635  ORF Transcript_42957/g.46635 Transcript_42957/m.46635 type:complete len:126 (-) Transcript_42957:3-380(-)